MLNSIGIPLLGLAPPPQGGAPLSEQPVGGGAGGFAAVLAAASQSLTAPMEVGATAFDLASVLEGAAFEEPGPPATSLVTPQVGTVALGTPAVGAFASTITNLERPDRLSEAAIDEGRELEVDEPHLEGSPPVTQLAGLMALVPPPPALAPEVGVDAGVPAVEAAATSPSLADVPTLGEAPASTVVREARAQAPAATELGETSLVLDPGPPPAFDGAPVTDDAHATSTPGAVATPGTPVSQRALVDPAPLIDASTRTEAPSEPSPQALQPQPREEVASALIAGDRLIEGGPPSMREQPSNSGSGAPEQGPSAAQPAPPLAPAVDAVTAESSEFGINMAGGSERASASAAPADDSHARRAGRVEVPLASSEAAAPSMGAGITAERPTEPRVSQVEATAPPLPARDPGALTRGLAESVRAAVRDGNETIRLVLNPPDLGHLDVRVTSGAEGLRVAVTASTAEATDLIRQHLPALVSGLEARELRVDRAEVRQAAPAEFGTDLGSREPGSGSRQPGEQSGGDGQSRWAAPEWSGVAALERSGTLPEQRRSEQASSRLLDMVA